MNRALPAILLVGLGLIALGVALPLWVSGRSLYAAWQFKPYPKPYAATIVAFHEHTRRYTTTAPIVEIARPDGTKSRFTSSHYSLLQPFALGEHVQLVTRSGTDAAGQPVEILEIDNAYHLWIKDCLLGLLLPVALLVSWIYGRSSDEYENPRRYRLPT